MKTIIIFFITSVLLSIFGCNYDYGKYGKDKTESTSSQTNTEGTIPNEESGSKN